MEIREGAGRKQSEQSNMSVAGLILPLEHCFTAAAVKESGSTQKVYNVGE